MESSKILQIKKSTRSHRVSRPTQTGFSSPATHYSEPRIDLNHELVKNSSSTFFIRVSDGAFNDHGIDKNDVLIIDRAMMPKPNQLALIIDRDVFKIEQIGQEQNNSVQLWGVITYIIKSVL